MQHATNIHIVIKFYIYKHQYVQQHVHWAMGKNIAMWLIQPITNSYCILSTECSENNVNEQSKEAKPLTFVECTD